MLRFDYPTPLRVSFISVPSDLLDATRSSIFLLRIGHLPRPRIASFFVHELHLFTVIYNTLAFLFVGYDKNGSATT